jgi:hypothetical protein
VKRCVSTHDGNVGIGTSSPNSYSGFTTLTLDGTSGSLLDLEVNGTVTGEIYADTSFGIGMQAIGSRDIQFKTNNTERMRIDSSGVVQISNTTPTLKFTDTDNNYDATIQGLSGSLVLKADSGAEFGTESIQFRTGGDEAMRIDSSGNVGIGTDSPFFTSATRKTLSINGTGSSNLSFGANGTAYGNIFVASNEMNIGTQTSANPFKVCYRWTG